MKYLHIKNLEEYHPGYKDRDLQWAKIYINMASGDPDTETLCEIDWSRLVKLILLELRAKKPLPLNEQFLTSKGFDLKKRSIELTLNMLHNFISIVDEESKVCVLDKIREDKKREDKERLQRPSLQDCKDFFKNDEMANNFFYHYEANGWVQGKNKPIKNWEASAVGWRNRNKNFGSPVKSPTKIVPVNTVTEDTVKKWREEAEKNPVTTEQRKELANMISNIGAKK